MSHTPAEGGAVVFGLIGFYCVIGLLYWWWLISKGEK